jgi:hypothetical protein
MALPNFFIIGAGKSGTTALYRYLRQHPDVYLPDVKEPRFFAHDPDDQTVYAGPNAERLMDSVVKDLPAYESLYEGVTREKAVGDASPAYLSSPVAARAIRERVPDARIVAVLRDPAERAYSQFIDNVRNGWEEERDFERVLALRHRRELERWWRKWDYVGHGFYHRHLTRYFEAFEPQQIRIYLYEDLDRDSRAVLQDLLHFLEVDPSVGLDVSARHNVSGVPRNQRLGRLLSDPNPARAALKALLPAGARARLRSRLESGNLHKPAMSAEARAQLAEIYAEDIKRLEALLDRDLSHWCRVPVAA